MTTFLPHKQTDPIEAAHLSSAIVFNRDYDELQNAAAVVAFLNEPSLGVGAEVALCLHLGIPILPLISTHNNCSRFLAGLLESKSVFLQEYADTNSIKNHLNQFLSNLNIVDIRNYRPSSRIQ